MYCFWRNTPTYLPIYLMITITLKIGKAICPVCDVIKFKQSVSSVSRKMTILGLFFVENKD